MLFPKSLYDRMPKLHFGRTNDAAYDGLRVVSVRLDPCFPRPEPGRACAPQIRMVLQPIFRASEVDALFADDAAIHTFYALDADELEHVLDEVVALRTEAGFASFADRLDVHPILASEGLDGSFGRDLKALLLRHAGEDNLTRATFMAFEGFANTWRFGGFDVEDGIAIAMTIPTLETTEQTFLNWDLFGETFLRVEVEPALAASDDLGPLLSEPSARDGSEAVEAAFDAAIRIENPEHHTPETIDCVSCHLATSARGFAERTLGFRSDAHRDAYLVDADLSLPSATSYGTNVLRAFGYFDRHPAVSQRTVNETHAVVAYVNSRRN